MNVHNIYPAHYLLVNISTSHYTTTTIVNNFVPNE